MRFKKIALIIMLILCIFISISIVSAHDFDDDEIDVDMDDVAVEHKKNNFFKVKVENDDDDKPIKNLKLKLKVFTKSKSKTYNLKTNSKGIAKFNTKNLQIGKHKVILTSSDNKYSINKKANIYVGKKYVVTLKADSNKKLKNNDIIKTYTKYDDNENELKVGFVKTPKHTIVLKAEFYLKNKITGKVIVKEDICEIDDGKFDLPDEDYSYKYTPTKIKISYISI